MCSNQLENMNKDMKNVLIVHPERNTKKKTANELNALLPELCEVIITRIDEVANNTPRRKSKSKTFDFSLESLAIIDDLLDHLRQQEEPPAMLINSLGNYVGEVIITHTHGYWINHEQCEPCKRAVVIPGIMVTNPYGKTWKRYWNSEEDSVEWSCRMIVALCRHPNKLRKFKKTCL